MKQSVRLQVSEYRFDTCSIFYKGSGDMVYETKSAEETHALGKMMGEKALPGEVYALSGDLGAGKTVFTQGFAEGLGVSGPVTSPTFTILQNYDDGRLSFYHFDVYRIEDIDEMDEIGCDDCFYGDGVCLVEWAEIIRELLPPDTVWVNIEKETWRGDDVRRITIRSGRAFTD